MTMVDELRTAVQPENSETGLRHRCSLCKKTFPHEASAKRHYYYCRSKPADSGSRKRSCVACARAKARCIWPATIGQGACIRCDKHSVTCEYDTNGIRRNVPDEAGFIAAAPIQGGPSLDGDSQESSTAIVPTRNAPHNDTALFYVPDQSYIDIGNTSELAFLDDLNLDVTLDDLGLNIEHVPYEGANSMSLACRKIANLLSTRRSSPMPWIYQPSNTCLFTTRAFTRPDHVALVSLAMRILKSFPAMMLAQGAFPPFISSSSYARARLDRTSNSHSCLGNCSSLVRSFNSQKKAGKSSWAWGQIWNEQERIRTEYANFDRWELLDALQTLLIFCLLRLQDAPVGHAVFDVSLLTTVNLVSQALDFAVGNRLDCGISEEPSLAWADWIFLESRRRTVIIFQIVGLLVDISTAVSYFSIGGLVLVPLPSSAALWSTQDFEQWKPEYRRWREQHVIYGLSEIGDLVRVRNTDDGLGSETVEWEDWSAEVGDPATLIMIIGELLRSQ
ncbi:hypothetical protein F4802DRAFT_417419 [Xylaria palmicola]|nr:hypothetical protein F4802DRAFT_417419 [Xylaria palmicola]